MFGVSRRPFGASSIHACETLWMISTVWWFLAMHSCASPDWSMKTPTTAKTLSSSVKLVQVDSACEFPMGQKSR